MKTRALISSLFFAGILALTVGSSSLLKGMRDQVFATAGDAPSYGLLLVLSRLLPLLLGMLLAGESFFRANHAGRKRFNGWRFLLVTVPLALLLLYHDLSTFSPGFGLQLPLLMPLWTVDNLAYFLWFLLGYSLLTGFENETG